MLLDNENENLKVHEWISKYTEEGQFDIVTGYFTVGALAYLSQQVNDKIAQFNFILGDIVNSEIDANRAIDLLNENITIEASFKHQNALNKIKRYQTVKTDTVLDGDDESAPFEDDDFEDMAELTLGKKRKIKLSEIDEAGKLDAYKKDLKKDIDALDNLFGNLERFQNKIQQEVIKPGNHQSADDKLQMLMEKIRTKQNSGANDNNRKLVIFTAYKDTATYLFEQLQTRGFSRIAMVSGSSSMTDDSDHETRNFEPILQRFAPFTKLFKEQEWQFETGS